MWVRYQSITNNSFSLPHPAIGQFSYFSLSLFSLQSSKPYSAPSDLAVLGRLHCIMGHLAVHSFYYSPAWKRETFGPHIDAVTSLRGWESSRLRLHLDGDGFSLHTPGWLLSLLIDRLSSSPPASCSGLISPDGHAGIKGIGGEEEEYCVVLFNGSLMNMGPCCCGA